MSWLPLGILVAVLVAASLRPRSRTETTTSSRGATVTAEKRSRRWLHPRRAREEKAGRGEQQPAGPDPFEVLRVQMRLGALAEEVRALERSGDVYARGHHLKATQAAYDALLIEACLLAGIIIATSPGARPTVPQGEQERFREEVELASRGWSW